MKIQFIVEDGWLLFFLNTRVLIVFVNIKRERLLLVIFDKDHIFKFAYFRFIYHSLINLN